MSHLIILGFDPTVSAENLGVFIAWISVFVYARLADDMATQKCQKTVFSTAELETRQTAYGCHYRLGHRLHIVEKLDNFIFHFGEFKILLILCVQILFRDC